MLWVGFGFLGFVLGCLFFVGVFVVFFFLNSELLLFSSGSYGKT